MNKREFLKKSAILGAGALVVPAVASSCMNSSAAGGATASLVAISSEGKFTLKKGDSIFMKAKEIRGIKALEDLVVLGVQDGH